MTDDQSLLPRRTTTGINGLDEVLGGGLFVGGVYLIAGRPGAGKTVLANQISFSHARNGGRILYVTLLAESHARMLLLMEQMSFFNEDAVGSSLQYISAYQTLEKEKLAGLLRLLRNSTREHNATMLVIDGLLTANDLAETDIELKKFIHEIQVLAELTECTTILLRGAHDTVHSYPERTMTDGLILLSSTRVGMRVVRELEVQKHRGTAHFMGGNFFDISKNGISVYPRTEANIGLSPNNDDEGSDTLVASGAKSLDVLLGGGLPFGSTTLVLGSPGIGKTTFGLQFLDEGARANEQCLYMGFGEPPTRIVRKGASSGLDLASHIKNGTLEIHCYSPQEPLADKLVAVLFENITRRKVQRLFIDGFDGFRAGLIYPDRVQSFAISVDKELKSRNVTTLWSEEIGVFAPELVLPTGCAQTVDNIVIMRYVDEKPKLRRFISVLKMSNRRYETSPLPFEITDRGVIVGTQKATSKVAKKISRRGRE